MNKIAFCLFALSFPFLSVSASNTQHDELLLNMGASPTDIAALAPSAKGFASSVISELLTPRGQYTIPLRRIEPPRGEAEVVMSVDESLAECKACVCQASRQVLTYAGEVVGKMCAFPHGHKLEYLCQYMKHQPEAAKGFIAFQSKPIMTGFAYCVGKGKCLCTPDGENFFVEETAMLQQGQCFDDDVDTSDETMSFQEYLALGDFDDAQPTIGPVSPKLTDDFKMCKHCIRIAMHHIMVKVEANLDEMCKNRAPDSKRLDYICNFIKNHPQFAHGYLLGLVAPWKFGSGYCAGIGVCKDDDTDYTKQSKIVINEEYPDGIEKPNGEIVPENSKLLSAEEMIARQYARQAFDNNVDNVGEAAHHALHAQEVANDDEDENDVVSVDEPFHVVLHHDALKGDMVEKNVDEVEMGAVDIVNIQGGVVQEGEEVGGGIVAVFIMNDSKVKRLGNLRGVEDEPVSA